MAGKKKEKLQAEEGEKNVSKGEPIKEGKKEEEVTRGRFQKNSRRSRTLHFVEDRRM